MLFSTELLFSVSLLFYLRTYDKEVSKTVNIAPTEVYNEFMRDMNSWNNYNLSYEDYVTSIIDALIVEQERAMTNVSQDDVLV